MDIPSMNLITNLGWNGIMWIPIKMGLQLR